MFGSLLMVEACSETDKEGGELVSDAAEPPDWTKGQSQLPLELPIKIC